MDWINVCLPTCAKNIYIHPWCEEKAVYRVPIHNVTDNGRYSVPIVRLLIRLVKIFNYFICFWYLNEIKHWNLQILFSNPVDKLLVHIKLKQRCKPCSSSNRSVSVNSQHSTVSLWWCIHPEVPSPQSQQSWRAAPTASETDYALQQSVYVGHVTQCRTSFPSPVPCLALSDQWVLNVAKRYI